MPFFKKMKSCLTEAVLFPSGRRELFQSTPLRTRSVPVAIELSLSPVQEHGDKSDSLYVQSSVAFQISCFSYSLEMHAHLLCLFARSFSMLCTCSVVTLTTLYSLPCYVGLISQEFRTTKTCASKMTTMHLLHKARKKLTQTLQALKGILSQIPLKGVYNRYIYIYIYI